MTKKITFIGHRGDMTSYPENTLAALKGAIDAGVRFVEFDLQLSSDLVPMLFHDSDLFRVTSESGNFSDFSASFLNKLQANKAGIKFNSIFDAHIPTLVEAIDLLNKAKTVSAFVEIKTESVDRFGLEAVVKAVYGCLEKARFPFVIISDGDEIIEYIQRNYSATTGWVAKAYSEQAHAIALKLKPTYLFCNVEKVPPDFQLWKGAWQWVLYDICDPQLALDLARKDIVMIETGDTIRMQNSELLRALRN